MVRDNTGKLSHSTVAMRMGLTVIIFLFGFAREACCVAKLSIDHATNIHNPEVGKKSRSLSAARNEYESFIVMVSVPPVDDGAYTRVPGDLVARDKKHSRIL